MLKDKILTPQQEQILKETVGKNVEDVTNLLGRKPSFREYINHVFEIVGEEKESFKSKFMGFKQGWELNGYEADDYNSVYNDMFDHTREDIEKGASILQQMFQQDVPDNEENIVPESLMEDEKTTIEKKSFKVLLGDYLQLSFGALFFLVLFGFIGYIIYKDFTSESQQYQSLIFGILTFGLMVYLIFSFTSKGGVSISFNKIVESYGLYIILIPIIVLIIVPTFIILVNILIFILTFWFIWLAIILLILATLIWVSHKFSSISILKKILLTALIAVTMYFFFDAKDILKFHFQTYFDNKKIHLSILQDE